MRAKGWKKVFKFTFIQNAKAKSFVVSTIIISIITALLIAGANVLPALAMEDDGDVGQSVKTSVKTVYLYDETGISTAENYSGMATAAGIEIFDLSAEELSAKTKEVNETTSPTTILTIKKTEVSYDIRMLRPLSEEVVSKGDCDMLLPAFKSNFEAQKLINNGVGADKVADSMLTVNYDSVVAGEEPINPVEGIVKTVVPMVSSIILFMLIFIYGQMVAQSIAIEKTSRVMELLLTSIRPLAVIVGKVLAMGSLALIQFVLFIGVGAGAFFATAPFGVMSKLQTLVDNGDLVSQQIMDGLSQALSYINPLSIVLIFVVFILGFLVYALIAGLIGASIDRMEDLSSAMQPMSFIGIVGFYLAYFPSLSSMDGTDPSMLTIISLYLPISSPFALPSAIITGTMQPLEIGISIFVLALSVALLTIFVARVYEHIVLHTGNRIKISGLLNLAKRK